MEGCGVDVFLSALATSVGSGSDRTAGSCRAESHVCLQLALLLLALAVVAVETVGRLGGDEFEQILQIASALVWLRRVLRILWQPIDRWETVLFDFIRNVNVF